MLELDRIGLDTYSPLEPLENLIFTLIGVEFCNDQFREEYYKLTELYAEKVRLFNPETAREQALELYWILRKKIEAN